MTWSQSQDIKKFYQISKWISYYFPIFYWDFLTCSKYFNSIQSGNTCVTFFNIFEVSQSLTKFISTYSSHVHIKICWQKIHYTRNIQCSTLNKTFIFEHVGL